MKIGKSLLNFMPGKVGGIETYIRKLIQHAPGLAGNDEIVFFVHRDNCASLQSSVSVEELPWRQRQVDAARILEAFTPWRARAVESLIADSGVDVMLLPPEFKGFGIPVSSDIKRYRGIKIICSTLPIFDK